LFYPFITLENYAAKFTINPGLLSFTDVGSHDVNFYAFYNDGESSWIKGFSFKVIIENNAPIYDS
jgi:hypothetical protein